VSIDGQIDSPIDGRFVVGLGDFRLDATLEVDAGEVVALLGPNGAGKSTTLRVIAGLVPLEAGRLALAGRVVDDPAKGIWVRPAERSVSVVFQEHLLFPHLSAVDNVAFGLRTHGMARADAARAAQGWLDRFELGERGGAKPRELSGGQSQRVALARALAPSPAVLLLDEPLAALDVGTRAAVRRDLRRHLEDYDGATVLVTHDPLDALALASRVVVIEGGTVTQEGPVVELARHPTSRYVADLVGVNLLAGVAHGSDVVLEPVEGAGRDGRIVVVADPARGPVHVLIHPTAVAVHTVEPAGSPRNRWPGRVAGFDLLGDRVRVRVEGTVPLVAEITQAAVADLGLQEGSEVWTSVKATEIETYPR
jgi:molybdate transport system ATP-binding protein